jgi:murein L,D-transpeptidase YafK
MKLVGIFMLISISYQCSANKTLLIKNDIADSICVFKSKRTMNLYQKGIKIKTYSISIGANPKGHKVSEGDNKTPEGLYIIDDKNPNSSYYKNLGISYPNEKDKKNARKLGLAPGGEIKIHGYADTKGSTREMYLKYDYTWGCIGMCNTDMKEVYALVKIGAKILLLP